MTAQIAGRPRALVAVAIAAIIIFASAAAWCAETPLFAELEPIRQVLDQVETALKQNQLTVKAVSELSRTIAPARDAAHAKVAELEPRAADAQSRLKQLGAPPAKDAPPEAAAIVSERASLTQSFSQLDASLRQAGLLALRADQLTTQIAQRRSLAYTQTLFARSWSALDPTFWHDAVLASGDDVRQLSGWAQLWASHVRDRAGFGRLAAAILTIAGIGAILWWAVRRWGQRFPPPAPVTRLAKARACVWAFFRAAVMAPLAVAIIGEVLDAYELAPPQLDDVAIGLIVATAIAAFGRGVTLGVLAPDAPERRLFAYDAAIARTLSNHLVVAARLLGLAIFVKVAHRVMAAPEILLVATSTLFVLAIVIVMLHLLLALRTTDTGEDGGQQPDGFAGNLWVRGIAWIYVLTAGASLVTAQVRFADFVSERLLATAAVCGALYLLLVLTDLMFTESFTTESPRGRAVATNLGLPPRRIGLVGALLSALVRVLLVILAVMLVVGPLEVTPSDLLDVVRGLTFGIRIGEISISLGSILNAVVIFALTLLVVRVVQRWLETRLLPRTEIEPSLQLSVGTIFGYAGFIVAVSLAMAAIGLDLQKIAFVAGALSVGIGFGLQSIVSNFVSGLILLAERPIRVGDWIVAKGEEGFVRRIRVRATEIETFERASVIIPNSDLISGVVKNWTHGNTIGRITIKIGVGYDSDPVAVRDLLLAIAAEHPGVLKIPAPAALFAAFGDSALNFELRCIVRDVQQSMVVRSELNFAILARFRAAKIELPFPQQTVHIVNDNPVPAGQE